MLKSAACAKWFGGGGSGLSWPNLAGPGSAVTPGLMSLKTADEIIEDLAGICRSQKNVLNDHLVRVIKVLLGVVEEEHFVAIDGQFREEDLIDLLHGIIE